MIWLRINRFVSGDPSNYAPLLRGLKRIDDDVHAIWHGLVPSNYAPLLRGLNFSAVVPLGCGPSGLICHAIAQPYASFRGRMEFDGDVYRITGRALRGERAGFAHPAYPGRGQVPGPTPWDVRGLGFGVSRDCPFPARVCGCHGADSPWPAILSRRHQTGRRHRTAKRNPAADRAASSQLGGPSTAQTGAEAEARSAARRRTAQTGTGREGPAPASAAPRWGMPAGGGRAHSPAAPREWPPRAGVTDTGLRQQYSTDISATQHPAPTQPVTAGAARGEAANALKPSRPVMPIGIARMKPIMMRER